MKRSGGFAIIQRKKRADGNILPDYGGAYMRGIPSLITDIRNKVFTEVARMAYSGSDYTKA